MKKLISLCILLIALTIAFGAKPSQAFNPATHIYIAEQVFPGCNSKIDLYYGSIAPDLALYVTKPEKWPTAFDDTHKEFFDLRPYAWSSTQMAFAKGWLTHNENEEKKWGADYYAHIYPGYVNQKANLLIAKVKDLLGFDLDPEFAHFAIEVAIDLLLKNDDPALGEKLLKANLLRSWEDRNLLVRVLVLKYKKTDWVTLASAELTFRNLVNQFLAD